ncbi:MAG TPA: hypothetical protein VEQ61_07365, partial [Thermoleophilaceae bacterium]|nr:hypothetical protein [Thermoleophilaceae bacterium]
MRLAELKAACLSAAALLALGAEPALAQGATGDEPAGGAAAAEAIGATAGAIVVTALLALLIAGHRSGRLRLLERLSAQAERTSGLPRWAALPSVVLSLSLLTALLGMYWDVSLHIDNGRDDGPLANPAHYLILFGLYGTLLAGVLSAALCRGRPSATAVHLGGDWWMPMGGVIITACGAFALAGFPLDDFWHRIFGQDVTLWGPTHLMLIGGGSLATLGGMALMTEGVAATGHDPLSTPRLTTKLRRALLVGGFLVALSTFQGEYDFGVPQFRLVLHPLLLMLAAGIGLVTIRVYLGRGGALYAVAGFLIIRGVLALMVGGVWGQTTPHFPLYIVEALMVELVFLRAAGRSPVAMGALSGVLVGTVGLAAEWGWSHLWMPIGWPSSLLPEALLGGLPAAIAAGAVGGFIGGSLRRPLPRAWPALRAERFGALAGACVLAGLLAWGVPTSDRGPDSATVSLRELSPAPERTVEATVRVKPADGARDAEFLTLTAWQGGGSSVDPLVRVGPGVYRTTKPVPVHGGWKAMVRLHRGDVLVGVPVFLPEDRGIPAPEVPARERFTREFLGDRELLQRERKDDVPSALAASAYATVLLIALSLLALIALALLRLEAGERSSSRRSRSRVRA